MTSLLAIGRGFPPTIQLGLCSQSEQICTNPGSTKFDWANSHKLSSLDELKKVKAEEGPEIVLWGSSTLYPQLLDANLIDRFLLFTCPIVLGKGKKLFGAVSHPVNMKLVSTDTTSTGVIIATYEQQHKVEAGV
jgi:dihydrofolate reductase